jgi:hypothetical protein
MSQTVSPSTSRCYGLARVSRAWSVRAPACIAFSSERHRLRSPVTPVRQAWLVARHGYKTPARIREEQTMPRIAINPTLAATLPWAA